MRPLMRTSRIYKLTETVDECLPGAVGGGQWGGLEATAKGYCVPSEVMEMELVLMVT